jgi:hypothetical protein
MHERRKSGRSRVLKGAKIILGNTSLLDCIVRNVTNVGARLQIANTVDLPETFDVTLDGGFTVRPSRVVWRTVTETGVEFV